MNDNVNRIVNRSFRKFWGVSGLDAYPRDQKSLPCRTPITGEIFGYLRGTDKQDIRHIVTRAVEAFEFLRKVPAPKRGELIRRFGIKLREHKKELAELVTLESGKIYQEALGEVQEMIDVCDFACGLSRQLYGLTMPSERPNHVMRETWHPLGPVVVISAFNFPVAVWAWNFAIAIVCGDPVIWKPSEKTLLCAEMACQLFYDTLNDDRELWKDIPSTICQLVRGNAVHAVELSLDARVKLVSATGSTGMGKIINNMVANRLGKTLLELGGNNAMIVSETYQFDKKLMDAIVFSAAGTAGQRCTSLRRLFIDRIALLECETSPEAFPFLDDLVRKFESLPAGDPFDPKTLVGPLISQASYDAHYVALDQAVEEGGVILTQLRYARPVVTSGGVYYVSPAVVLMPSQTSIVLQETFSPILYIIPYDDLDDAIRMNNEASHGLSSCIFTNSVQEAEKFMAESDCGIANVNIGPSGAEIGGAFGGEKDTGGGRESGSDSWKAYMRRATNTINYGSDLPLAQGIKFGTG